MNKLQKTTPDHLSLCKFLMHIVRVWSGPRTINITTPKTTQKLLRRKYAAGNICASIFFHLLTRLSFTIYIYIIFLKSHNTKSVNYVYFHLKFLFFLKTQKELHRWLTNHLSVRSKETWMTFMLLTRACLLFRCLSPLFTV